MSESRFKTMRHIETVRNYIGTVIKELMKRQQLHDQTKLQSPEVEIFEIYTPKLRDCVYGSDEYRKFMDEMKPAIDHHNANNRHHPEHFKNFNCNGCHTDFKVNPGVCNVCGYSQFQEEPDMSQMNLIDLIEMLCDWKAATLRHNTGDIRKSLEINQKRFRYSDEIKTLLNNTVDWLEGQFTFTKADES